MLDQLLLLLHLYLHNLPTLLAFFALLLGYEVFESSFDDVEVLLAVVLDESEQESFSLFLLQVYCFPGFEGCLAAGEVGTDHVVLQLKLGAFSCILYDFLFLKRLAIGLVYKFTKHLVSLCDFISQSTLLPSKDFLLHHLGAV